jgi:hypothetical protein
MMKLILRVTAVLVALGFLVAYVLHASGRLSLFAVKPKTEKDQPATPLPRNSMVLPSSKAISQPVFSTRAIEPSVKLWETSLMPTPTPAFPTTMGGSKSFIIKIYEPSPTPAKP